MTEKRFTFHHDVDGVDYIEDENNGFCLICDELMCNLLNGLHSRNKRLEEKIQRERTSFTKTHERWSKEAENKIKELSEENEQLKKDVEYWKQVASQYSNELNVFEHCKKYKTECKDIHWSSD